MSLTEMMQQFQIVETILKGQPNVNFVLCEFMLNPRFLRKLDLLILIGKQKESASTADERDIGRRTSQS